MEVSLGAGLCHAESPGNDAFGAGRPYKKHLPKFTTTQEAINCHLIIMCSKNSISGKKCMLPVKVQSVRN